MQIKIPYIIIPILLITNLVSINYVIKYYKHNQYHRNKVILNEYLLALTNKTEGNVKALKIMYPNIAAKNNLIVIDKNTILKNTEFKEYYNINNIKDFYGFEFKINKNGKIIVSRFYKP